jgi:hypothetical protein
MTSKNGHINMPRPFLLFLPFNNCCINSQCTYTRESQTINNVVVEREREQVFSIPFSFLGLEVERFVLRE